MKRISDTEYWRFTWINFKKGDREAFKIIYNEFIDSLFAYGLKITPKRGLVEDAIQDLFIDVYTYGNTLKKPESLEFYLFKTLKRIIYRKLKEQNRYDLVDQPADVFDLKFSVEEKPSLEIDKKETLLRGEIANLNSKKRELLYLKFNSGLSYDEIGNLLELKPDTVKKQVYRLVQHLRNRVDKKIMGLLFLCFRTQK